MNNDSKFQNLLGQVLYNINKDTGFRILFFQEPKLAMTELGIDMTSNVQVELAISIQEVLKKPNKLPLDIPTWGW